MPEWREMIIKPAYRLEGTENTTADSYLKRHQKFENEEIRIKRWDMRRQKEEYERNKLLKGRYASQLIQQQSSKSKTATPQESNSSLASACSSTTSLSHNTATNGIYFRKPTPTQIDEAETIEVVEFNTESIPTANPTQPNAENPQPAENPVIKKPRTKNRTKSMNENENSSQTAQLKRPNRRDPLNSVTNTSHHMIINPNKLLTKAAAASKSFCEEYNVYDDLDLDYTADGPSSPYNVESGVYLPSSPNSMTSTISATSLTVRARKSVPARRKSLIPGQNQAVSGILGGNTTMPVRKRARYI